MTDDLAARGQAFRALHHGPDIFVMPCAWDFASAMQFEAAASRAVFALVADACRELQQHRTFSFTPCATPEDDVNVFFR